MGAGAGATLFVCEAGKKDTVEGAAGAPKLKDGAAAGGFDTGGKREGVVVGGANAEFDVLVVDSSSLSMKPPSFLGGRAGVAVPNMGAFATSLAGAPHMFWFWASSFPKDCAEDPQIFWFWVGALKDVSDPSKPATNKESLSFSVETSVAAKEL